MRLLITVAAALAALDSSPPGQVQFRLSEAEVNRHMRVELAKVPESGVEKLTFKFFPANYVSTFTVINFDQVARTYPEYMPGPVRLALSGRRNLLVDFRFRTDRGRLVAKVEKASIDDLQVPPRVIESLIRLAASSDPEKLNVTQGVTMPWGVKQLATEGKLLTGNN